MKFFKIIVPVLAIIMSAFHTNNAMNKAREATYQDVPGTIADQADLTLTDLTITDGDEKREPLVCSKISRDITEFLPHYEQLAKVKIRAHEELDNPDYQARCHAAGTADAENHVENIRSKNGLLILDSAGRNLVHAAALDQNIYFLQALMKHPETHKLINRYDERGLTPLHTVFVAHTATPAMLYAKLYIMIRHGGNYTLATRENNLWFGTANKSRQNFHPGSTLCDMFVVLMLFEPLYSFHMKNIYQAERTSQLLPFFVHLFGNFDIKQIYLKICSTKTLPNILDISNPDVVKEWAQKITRQFQPLVTNEYNKIQERKDAVTNHLLTEEAYIPREIGTIINQYAHPDLDLLPAEIKVPEPRLITNVLEETGCDKCCTIL